MKKSQTNAVLTKDVDYYFKQGKNLKEIAKLKGVSASALYSAIKDKELDLPGKIKEKNIKKTIQEYFSSGKSVKEIAEKMVFQYRVCIIGR